MAYGPRWASVMAVILGLAFGVIRLLSSSGIVWVRQGVELYIILEYPFFFLAVFLGIYGYTDLPRVALFFATILTIGLWILITGGAF